MNNRKAAEVYQVDRLSLHAKWLKFKVQPIKVLTLCLNLKTLGRKMKKPMWPLTICFLVVLVTPAISQENGGTREGLKELVGQALGFAPGLQDVRIGPFKDGTFARLQIEYLQSESGSKLIIENNKPDCISIDRADAAKGIAISDAFEQCQIHKRCNFLAGYLDSLWKTQNADKISYFDDVYKNLTQSQGESNVSAEYAQIWMTQFVEMLLAIQMHEIAHALLHRNIIASAATEAEADGFAAGLAEMANIPITKVGQFLALTVPAERSYLATPHRHPPSECRIEAFRLGIRGWYEKHPQFNIPIVAARQPLSTIHGLDDFLPNNDQLCKEYSLNFHNGVSLVAEKVSQQTGFEILFEGFGDRCEINGGTKR